MVLTLLYALQMLLMMKASAFKQSWTSCATKPDAMPAPWLSICRALWICQPLKSCPSRCMTARKATQQPQRACQMSSSNQHLAQVKLNSRKGRTRVRGRGRVRVRGRASVRGTASAGGSLQAGVVRQSWQQSSTGCQRWSSKSLQLRSGVLLNSGSAMSYACVRSGPCSHVHVCNHICMLRYQLCFNEVSTLWPGECVHAIQPEETQDTDGPGIDWSACITDCT